MSKAIPTSSSSAPSLSDLVPGTRPYPLPVRTGTVVGSAAILTQESNRYYKFTQRDVFLKFYFYLCSFVFMLLFRVCSICLCIVCAYYIGLSSSCLVIRDEAHRLAKQHQRQSRYWYSMQHVSLI